MNKDNYTEYGYRGVKELADALKRVKELEEELKKIKQELQEEKDGRSNN